MRKLAIGIGLAVAAAVVVVVVVVALVAVSGPAHTGSGASGAAPPVGGALHSRAWTLIAVRDQGRVIVIRYIEGDCWGPGHARVTQTSTAVTIAVLQPHASGVCPQFLLGREISVGVAVPIGRRRLIHASLG